MRVFLQGQGRGAIRICKSTACAMLLSVVAISAGFPQRASASTIALSCVNNERPSDPPYELDV
ncbi:MAG: hypothetical protein ACREEB_05985, partial [Caulobacteraceae bacterium]